MKILFLAPQPFFEERGTPIAVRTAAEGLAAQGHLVDLLTYHVGQEVEMRGVTHHRIAAPPGIGKVPIGFSLKKLVCDLWMIGSAIRLMTRGRYDVIHAVEESVFIALFLPLIRGAKVVYDADSILSEQIAEKWSWATPISRALAWCERLAFRKSDLVLAVCPAIRDSAASVARPSRVHLLPDIAFDAPEVTGEVDDIRALGEGRQIALYVGNLEAYQGVGLLLEAQSRIPVEDRPMLVVIGGDAAAVERHGDLARSLGVDKDVRLLGPRPLAALQAYLNQADILCSPRMKGRNTPMKIFSYMGSARPILATDIESHTQVLDGECAYLVAPEAEAMADGLRDLTRDAALRGRLAEAAGVRARTEYSHAAFLARLQRAYDTLVVPP
ncbi:MAG: glycosyltransferase, partial [Sphingobium sp.]